MKQVSGTVLDEIELKQLITQRRWKGVLYPVLYICACMALSQAVFSSSACTIFHRMKAWITCTPATLENTLMLIISPRTYHRIQHTLLHTTSSPHAILGAAPTLCPPTCCGLLRALERQSLYSELARSAGAWITKPYPTGSKHSSSDDAAVAFMML